MRKKTRITLLLAALALSAWFFIPWKPAEAVKKDLPGKMQQTVDQTETKSNTATEDIPAEEKKTAAGEPTSYSFVLRPLTTQTVRFPIAGTLETGKNMQAGDSFSKNELLFQLDNSALFTEISRKKTELKSKLENLYGQISRETPEAYPKWHAYGDAITETDLLPPLPEHISSRERSLINTAGIVPLSLQIAQKEQEIFNYFYLAPFDGRIQKILVRGGKRIPAQQSVAIIYRHETMLLQRKIHSNDLKNYAGKQEFELSNGNGKQVARLHFKAGKQTGDSVVVSAKIAAAKLESFDFFETIEISSKN